MLFNNSDVPVAVTSLTELCGLQAQPEGAPVYVVSQQLVYVQTYALPPGIVASADGSSGAVQSAAVPGTYWVASSVAGAGAGKNRAWGFGSATTAGAGGLTVVAAMKLIAKTSGIFVASWNVLYNGLATDTVQLQTRVVTDNVAGVPLTLGNCAPIGFGSDALAQPGNVSVTDNGVYASNNAAGITVTGGDAGFTLDLKPIVLGAAPATGAILVWNGITGRSLPTPGNERPVVLGKTCLITAAVSNNHGPQSTGNIVGYMFEL